MLIQRVGASDMKSKTPFVDIIQQLGAIINTPTLPNPFKHHSEPLGFVSLPLSKSQQERSLLWQAVEPLDFPECDVSAKSEVLGVRWYISFDKHGRYRLTLGGMIISDKVYEFLDTAQMIAERCEDAVRNNPVAFADVKALLEKCP